MIFKNLVLQALGTICFRFLQKMSKKIFHACVPLMHASDAVSIRKVADFGYSVMLASDAVSIGKAADVGYSLMQASDAVSIGKAADVGYSLMQASDAVSIQ